MYAIFLCYRLSIHYINNLKKQIFKQFFFLFRMVLNYKKSLFFFGGLKYCRIFAPVINTKTNKK